MIESDYACDTTPMHCRGFQVSFVQPHASACACTCCVEIPYCTHMLGSLLSHCLHASPRPPRDSHEVKALGLKELGFPAEARKRTSP